MRIIKNNKIDKLINHIELQDLAEFEASDEFEAEYARGLARGLRLALELIDKHAVPERAIIKRGTKLSLVKYEEDDPWTSTISHQMTESV